MIKLFFSVVWLNVLAVGDSQQRYLTYFSLSRPLALVDIEIIEAWLGSPRWSTTLYFGKPFRKLCTLCVSLFLQLFINFCIDFFSLNNQYFVFKLLYNFEVNELFALLWLEILLQRYMTCLMSFKSIGHRPFTQQ